jgi:hypothetical protein
MLSFASIGPLCQCMQILSGGTSGSVDWLDPFVGARVRQQLAPGQEIVLRGDVGGFGAGSQFSWQAIGTYNWLLGVTHGIPVDGYVGFRAFRQTIRRVPAHPNSDSTTSYTDR